LVEYELIETPFQFNFSVVRFLNGQYVAWDDTRNILTSDDGVNWLHHESPTDSQSETYIDYGNGVYNLATKSGHIWVSKDLQNWTEVYNLNPSNHPTWPYLNGIKFIDQLGVFQASGNAGRIHQSKDGYKWGRVADQMADAFDWELSGIFETKKRIYTPGKFRTYESVDGKRWSHSSIPISVRTIIEGNDMEIAISQTGIYASFDSIQWYTVHLFDNGIVHDQAYGDLIHQVIVTDNSKGIRTILESDGGTHWSSRPFTESLFNPNSVCFGKSQFVMVGENGLILRSAQIHQPLLNRLQTGVSAVETYFEGENLLLNPRYTGPAPLTYQWLHNGTPIPQHNADLVINAVQLSDAGIYKQIIEDSLGNTIFTEVELIVKPKPAWASWTHIHPQNTPHLKDVQWIRNKYWAVGKQGALWTTIDGLQWDQIPLPTEETINHIGELDEDLLLLGNNGTILTSSNEKEWITVDYPTRDDLLSFHPGGPLPVVVGRSGHLTTYSSGAWIVRPTETQDDLNDLEHFGSGYLVIGNSGTILASMDGITWNDVSLNDAVDLHTITKSHYGAAIGVAGKSSLVLWEPDPAPEAWKDLKITIPDGSDGGYYAAVSFVKDSLNGDEGFILSGENQTHYLNQNSSGKSIHIDYPNQIRGLASNPDHQVIAVGNHGSHWIYDKSNNQMTGRTDQVSLDYLAHGNGLYLTVGYFRGGFVSEDGKSWNPLAIPAEGNIRQLVFHAGYFYIWDDTNTISKSIDGTTWTVVNSVPTGTWSLMTVFRDKLVLSTDSNVIFSSTDLLKWDQYQIKDTIRAMRVIEDELWVCGSNNLAMRSRDLIQWEQLQIQPQVSGSFYEVFRVNGNTLLIGGNRYPNYVSSDNGTTWTEFRLNYIHPEISLASRRLLEVYVVHGHAFAPLDGLHNTVAHSTDGISWDLIQPDSGVRYSFVSAFQDRAMMIGEYGHIALSNSLSNRPNQAPKFEMSNHLEILEDTEAQLIDKWAESISVGPGEESIQTAHFSVTTDRPDLFIAAPSIDASGSLRFTPQPNAYGAAVVSVVLKDNGGTSNGGIDISPKASFLLNILPVNDPPSFVAGPHLTLSADAGKQEHPLWARNITSGPENEMEQTVQFILSTDKQTLFDIQPTISPEGTLSFQPNRNASGTAVVEVQLKDSGGNLNGGSDKTSIVTFQITITERVLTSDDFPKPSFKGGPDLRLNEDSGAFTIPGWATEMSSGLEPSLSIPTRFEASTDNPNLFFRITHNRSHRRIVI
jgi:photosystem II stability/assembly factor-like uncharacterized protein